MLLLVALYFYYYYKIITAKDENKKKIIERNIETTIEETGWKEPQRGREITKASLIN